MRCMSRQLLLQTVSSLDLVCSVKLRFMPFLRIRAWRSKGWIRYASSATAERTRNRCCCAIGATEDGICIACPLRCPPYLTGTGTAWSAWHRRTTVSGSRRGRSTHTSRSSVLRTGSGASGSHRGAAPRATPMWRRTSGA